MQITSKKISDSIKIPTSKSYGNRAIILAALSGRDITLTNLPSAQDTTELLEVMKNLGLINEISDHLCFKKSFPEDELITDKPVELYLGEGGTTIRFLLAFLSLGCQKYRIKVHPDFLKRPYQELIDQLVNLGVHIDLTNKNDGVLEVQGPIKKVPITIDCSKTSQNASAFLLIQKKIDLELELINLFASKDYIEMTKFLCHQFDFITNYSIPVDMSSASYFIALAAISKQKLNISNITQIDSLQADSRIFEILKMIGCSFEMSSNGLNLLPPKGDYKSFGIDMSECLDLTPTLVFMACFIKGESAFRNISNLKFKETNRIESICEVLNIFEIKFEIVANDLKVIGKDRLSFDGDINFNVASDHRIVMMTSLFIKVLGGGTIHPSNAVNKSFPEFFELINGVNTVSAN